MKTGTDGFSHFRQVEVVGDVSEAGNGIQLVPGATGSGSQVKAVGDDTNVDVLLYPKGTGKFGYPTGVGGAVTQATNRSTGVTLNKACGAITTNAASLAAGGEATFTVTNSTVAIGDVVVVCARSGQTAGTSIPVVTAVAAGSFDITLTNLHASTADTGAMIINFAVIKSVSA